MTTAPVLFLIFNRPDLTAEVMAAISRARPSRLYVAADGPRADRAGEAQLCNEARRIATAVDWPCEVRTLFREGNFGVRVAVGSAIDWFFKAEEEGIILEDDCLPSADFFTFCEELLGRFRHDERVMAVCGSCYAKPDASYQASYYFCYYADIWGWATWRRAWRLYDRDLSRWPLFRAQRGLEVLAGGQPWREAFWSGNFDTMRQRAIDTWDTQWIFTVIEQNGLGCYPVRNLVSNLGFRADAAHTLYCGPGQSSDPLANLPHEKLSFPLVHPTSFARSARLEAEIEAKRLKLGPSKGDLRMKLKMILKSSARKILGETVTGMIDFYRHPERGKGECAPFNGQAYRQQTFGWILAHMGPAAIVETGTYLGATTEFMAETNIPLYTIESNPRNYGFARARLWRRPNLTMRLGDSRAQLQALFDGPLRSMTNKTIFVYLDAHWNADLPLGEELDIVFDNCPASVVMIDDFQVPDDPGYGYDDYGPGKALTSAYIAPAVARHGLGIFYPSTPSSQEGGALRGCVVLAKNVVHGRALASCPLLRAAE